MNYTELLKMPEGSALIYQIKNLVNGNSYIGSTVQPKRRKSNHFKLLSKGLHTSFLLQRAWDKHGKDNFEFKALFVCPKDQRFFFEQKTMIMGDYNLLKVVGMPPAGSMSGLKHTKEGIKNLKDGALKRWNEERKLKYIPLCESAWKLVEKGMPKYKACKEIGISHSTFWRWIKENDLKEWWNK